MSAPLSFDEYCKLASRTASVPELLHGDIGVTNAIVGALVAAGGLADLLKKQLYYGRTITADQYRSAVEDVRIQLELLEQSLDVSLVYNNPLPYNVRILHGTLGRISEDGEMLDALLEVAHDDQATLDLTNLIEEAGDGLWYTAEQISGVQALTGADAHDIAARNIAKLKIRYSDRFDGDSSIERDLEAERRAVEGAT